MQKVHRSAVCLVPPRSVWAQVQEVRVFRDKSFARWMPHINLLYPFHEDTGDAFEAAAACCAEALRGFSPFQVKLESLRFFEHGRSCTVWVEPEAEELQAVQAALVEAFPECIDLSWDPKRDITRFVPHLSLGQWRGRAEAAAAVEELGAAWQPLRFEAEGVALISRQGFDDPFTLRYLAPFGGGPPRRLDLPYVATVGPPAPVTGPVLAAGALAVGAGATAGATTGAAGPGSPEAAATGGESGGQGEREDFGLGPWRDGIWSFAYGANMCPAKLEGSRGLRPLESLPGHLPGWRLSFTHRGAMGNLVRIDGAAGAAAEGAPHVHGVLHRLTPAEYAKLANMEHEYRPEVVEVVRYDGRGAQLAVAFVTPQDRLIREWLPPPSRYLGLLQEGAAHWGLDAAYVRWLGGLRGIDGRERGGEYYETAQGAPLPALPKIRTGSEQQQRGRWGGRGQRAASRDRGGGGGRGGRGPSSRAP